MLQWTGTTGAYEGELQGRCVRCKHTSCKLSSAYSYGAIAWLRTVRIFPSRNVGLSCLLYRFMSLHRSPLWKVSPQPLLPYCLACRAGTASVTHPCARANATHTMLKLMSADFTLQVWNRVLAPMSGQSGSENIAAASVGILKQALQVSAEYTHVLDAIRSTAWMHQLCSWPGTVSGRSGMPKKLEIGPAPHVYYLTCRSVLVSHWAVHVEYVVWHTDYLSWYGPSASLHSYPVCACLQQGLACTIDSADQLVLSQRLPCREVVY